MMTASPNKKAAPAGAAFDFERLLRESDGQGRWHIGAKVAEAAFARSSGASTSWMPR